MAPYNQNVIYTVTPTITAGAYTGGDVIGGLIEIEIKGAGGGGTLRRLVIADDADQKAAMTVYLFTAEPSAIADNAAFAPTIADLQKLVGVVPVAAGDYTTINSNAYGIVDDLGIDFFVTGGTLYAYAVLTSNTTYAAATDLTFRFGYWQD